MTSLSKRLTRSLLGATILLVTVGLVSLYLAAQDAVIDQFDVTLRAKALAIETLDSTAPANPNETLAARFVHGFDVRRQRDYFELRDGSGTIVEHSDSVTHQLAPPSALAAKPRYWNLPLPTGRPGRAIGFAYKIRGSSVRTLVVASDRYELGEDLRTLILISIALTLALLGTMAWVITRALRRGLAPLHRLGEQAEAINSTSLATRFSVDNLPEELQPIARRLNDLLARIEQSFERERRFSADLAHELRTPLAELRSAAECALKWPDSRDPSHDKDTVDIATQMEGIVSHILTLARSEERQTRIRMEPVDLVAMTRERWSLAAAKLADPQASVHQDLKPAFVQADPTLLQAIVDNLLENAAEYASAPSQIDIATQGRTLRVTNTASDLSEADLPQLFERFWRKESARSGGHHLGLGLALARAFAESMGWKLEARLRSPGLLEMTLSGPAVSAQS